MPQTSIDHVQVGQVLEGPVANASGIVLVRAGTTLTAPLIERLRDLGIAHLGVKTVSEGGRLSAEERAAIEDRFRGHDDNPLMLQLKALLVGGGLEHAGGG